MLLKKNKFSLARRWASQRESGYSIVEVVVAISMSATLGLAASATIMWGLNVGAKTQANISLSSKTARILDKFEASVKDSDAIISATGTQVKYTFQRGVNCELHTYNFDTSNGRTSLIHTVRSAALRGGNYCSNVQAALVAGTIGNQTSLTEVDNLGSASGFNYFSADGKRSLMPGEPGYDASTALALCRIGSITIVIYNKEQLLSQASSARNKAESLTTGLRSNNYGLTC